MPVDVSDVRARFKAGESVTSIAGRLNVSKQYIRRLVSDLQTSMPRVPWRLMLAAVAVVVRTHGANFGREMLYQPVKDALHAAYGGVYSIPYRGIRAALRIVCPRAHRARQFWATFKLPRGHYVADHFLYSTHMDLDCKLQEHGLFVGGVIDGDSRKVLRLVALPSKLPWVIFAWLWFPVLCAFGTPDCLVTDKGKEWNLCVFLCWFVFKGAGRVASAHGWRRPHKYTYSTYNTRIERFWNEVNARVLLYFRLLLNAMEASNIYDSGEPVCVGAFSALAMPLLQFALDQLQYSWNTHRVRDIKGFPGSGGKPDDRARARPHPGGQLPLPNGGVARVMRLYEQAKSVRLRLVPTWAAKRDPLHGLPALQARRAAGAARILGTDMAAAWADLLAGRYDKFINAYAYWLRCRPERCAVLTHGAAHCTCCLCQLP